MLFTVSCACGLLHAGQELVLRCGAETSWELRQSSQSDSCFLTSVQKAHRRYWISREWDALKYFYFILSLSKHMYLFLAFLSPSEQCFLLPVLCLNIQSAPSVLVQWLLPAEPWGRPFSCFSRPGHPEVRHWHTLPPNPWNSFHSENSQCQFSLPGSGGYGSRLAHRLTRAEFHLGEHRAPLMEFLLSCYFFY